jgi:rRNA maturation endonuclease Nob1
LRHTACGKLTRAGQVCSECGGPITIKTARLEPRDASLPDPA